MSLIDKQSRERIRDLNDAFRKTLDPNLGKLLMTSGVSDLPSDVRAMAIRDSPVRREISRIEKWSRWRQRRMTLNNSMSITPLSPAQMAWVGFKHGSVLDGKIPAAWVSSQRKSTLTGDG
jgi:hypothetical protein